MMTGMIVFVPLIRLKVGLLKPESISEHVAVSLIVTPIPTAFVVVAVFWPLVYAVRRWRNPSKWTLGLAGLLATPLAVLLLGAIGTALWGPIRRGLPWSEIVLFPSIYAVGGLVFGVTVGWLSPPAKSEWAGHGAVG
jgi:hypothetical protein